MSARFTERELLKVCADELRPIDITGLLDKRARKSLVALVGEETATQLCVGIRIGVLLADKQHAAAFEIEAALEDAGLA
jgi:hypothetical protein